MAEQVVIKINVEETINQIVKLTQKIDQLSASGTNGDTAADTAEMQRLLTQLKASIDSAVTALSRKED